MKYRNYRSYILIGLLFLFLEGCISKPLSWKDELHKDISLLGHCNWIVVTDMAYPLQSREGIKTFYTGEDYQDILSYVMSEINQAPHIKATIYQDRELMFMEEPDAPGVTELRLRAGDLLGDRLQYIPHEQLISRLDSVSRIFNVIILKSNLTIPYTSTFFELDCRYWDNIRQKELEKRIQ